MTDAISNLLGGQPNQVSVPAFTSSGGVTQEQTDLGQYRSGEDLLALANQFGSSGTGMSTMATQAAEGAKNTEAMRMAGYSDANQGAQYSVYQNDLTSLAQQLQDQARQGAQVSSAIGNLSTGLGAQAGKTGAATI